MYTPADMQILFLAVASPPPSGGGSGIAFPPINSPSPSPNQGGSVIATSGTPVGTIVKP